MNIAVIGVGHVGLTISACLALKNHNVICYDNDDEKISNIIEGKMPFYEPKLHSILLHGMNNHLLRFTTDTQMALQECDICFIAVGTPIDLDGSVILNPLYEAIDEIAYYATDSMIIAIKSTVPVGTTKILQERISSLSDKRKRKSDVSVVMNPEFLSEGNSCHDFLYPARYP